MSTNITNFVKRPGPGHAGRAIRVCTNYFEVVSLPVNNMHHYDVTIDPPNAPSPLYRKVWRAFEDTDGHGMFQGLKVVFDGRKNAFSPKPLQLGDERAKQFDVSLQGCGGQNKRIMGSVFTIRIKWAGEVNMKELGLFLSAKCHLSSNCMTAVMVLDILIRHMPSLIHSTIGRSFYTPKDSCPLPNGTEVWQGFYQSARPGVGKMFINIDVSATTFYESGRLLDMVVKYLGRRSIDDLRCGLSDTDRVRLERQIKGVKILVNHRGEIKRHFKIVKLTPCSAEQTIFKDDTGKETTIVQYFHEKYNCRLSCPFLPCVIVKKHTFLPMEVCEVAGGQRYTKKLNEKQTASMIKYTCQKPLVRANKIAQGLQLLHYHNNPYLQQVNLQVKPEMAMINARVLPAPQISYASTTPDNTFAPKDGTWNLKGRKLAQGTVLGAWSVVNFSQQIPLAAIQRFISELCQTFINAGLNVVNRHPPITNADPHGNIDRNLKEAWLKAGNAAKATPQLILCIMPNTGASLYAEIKRISDTVIGIPTQCLQSKFILDPKKQYCANICLKVNMKLGGMNLFLGQSQIPFIAQQPTIVFGADVTHPSPGDSNRPSVAAVTASMDARASRYASTIRVQANRTEIVADLANMVKELLKSFYQSCGQKPKRILFYRDGVSEGQFKHVLDSEVQGIKAGCSSLNANYRPMITFIIVQKRHHTRFFPTSVQDCDRSGNCTPGTVVDTGIVHPFEFDFYLQSHAGLQGTSRPTHYHVLYDDNNFTPDSLQELTYRLCYIYGRATRAVSIVPPAYYADLVAARARFHRRSESWSDADGSTEGMDSEQQLASFATVKPELQKVMYYM